LSVIGTTEPRYFLTSSGYSRTASEIGMKITPALASSALKVVATETESNTASTATRPENAVTSFPSTGTAMSSRTPARIFCSCSGMPSLA